MINPTKEDIGKRVIYIKDWMTPNDYEYGFINSFNDTYVFVIYGDDSYPKSTYRRDLIWNIIQYQMSEEEEEWKAWFKFQENCNFKDGVTEKNIVKCGEFSRDVGYEECCWDNCPIFHERDLKSSYIPRKGELQK